jgi:FtsZ-binding cell division protein ZapB
MVVNPAYRTLDGQARKKIGVLNRKIAEFGAVNLECEIEPREVEAFMQRKSDLQESITLLQKEVDELKARRKATKRHIPYKELPLEARFDRLSTQSKHFIDTIKMIAYRAETAMSQILRQKMTRHHDARSLLRAIYSTEVDIVPDQQAKTLTIRLHPLANTSSLRQEKSRKGGRECKLKPFVAIQRVRLPPGKGKPASRKRALQGWWQHHS